MRGAVGMERHADDQRVGLPFGDQRARSPPKRASPSAATVVSGVAVRGQRVAGGDADAPDAEIESEKGLERDGAGVREARR